MAIDQDSVGRLPTRPGVYLFRDRRGDILYIGKARSLRARVRSYFRSEASHSIKTRELARRVESVETIVVGSEAEALILEANLIKEHRPSFNINLRDDKRYPYIKVTVPEPFPRVFVTRRLRNDGGRYFGPYTSVGRLRQALHVIKRLYSVRSCRYDLPGDAPQRACLDYHLGRCQAPCVGLQSQESYGDMIREIMRVLAGETEVVRGEVEGKMREAAERLDFEVAAHYRDVIEGLDSLAREQRVERFGGGDHDVVGLARDGVLATAVVLRIRKGLLLGRETQRFSGVGDEEVAPLLSTFAAQFYLGRGEAGRQDLPREVLLPADFPDRQLVEETLSGLAGRRVRLLVPQRGEKRRLVELAGSNARHVLEDRVVAAEQAADRADELLYQVQERLGLKVVPRLMVCFDVSHTQGSETVASAVTFRNGEPDRSGYRHMRIRGEWGNDDYRSMEEAVRRYFSGRVDKGEPLPDLAVIDGGRGQLGAALEALERVEVTDVAVVSLAKREEEVYAPDSARPLSLGRRDPALHLLQRIRDEAHRFAVTYNRALRAKRTIRSELADIPGIGPRRQRALLARFGSVRKIREASLEEIARVPGFSDVLAGRVVAYLGR